MPISQAIMYLHSNTTCPITQLKVQPYQRINDTITRYPIKIETYTNQGFEIKYRYSEVIQFSRQLQRKYASILKNTTLPILKKEKKYYYNFLKKGNQKYIDRQVELEQFCKNLLALPAVITCSDLFLSFFSEKHQQNVLTNTTTTTPSSSSSSSSSTLKRVFSLKSNSSQVTITNNKSLFQRPTTTTENNTNSRLKYDLTEIGLSRTATATVACMSPLSQQQSMISTTTSSSNRSSATSSMLFSSSLSSTEEDNNTIKFKIVYDHSNIVIIRVSRFTSLDQLRTQVIQKFALLNIILPIELTFTCIENARYSSASSIIYSDSLDLGSLTTFLISDDEQLTNAMQTKWSCLAKVTLRCMV